MIETLRLEDIARLSSRMVLYGTILVIFFIFLIHL
ncbi:MAG: sortase B protein-sorting domain-containing protein [Desulfofustis sp. PB-SRB1]|nr:sortase B protein-sorting domain-containing protein [Desulfofustis sp. PB-SRB1]